ncbi:MAG: sigma 54-interacting transcriptional regulator [Gammaproteobacteria bacterium]
MARAEKQGIARFDEDAALRTIVEGTATATGQRFFAALVESLARALRTQGAWVTEYMPESRRLRALAFWLGDRFIEWERVIDGSPCEIVVTGARLVHYPDRVFELFPNDEDVRNNHVMSYLGVPLLDLDGSVLGHLAVMDPRPMPEEPRALAIFRIFAARAAAELQRLRAERAVREREEKLGRLFDGAMDAIIEIDQGLIVTHCNPAVAKVLRCDPDRLARRNLGEDLLEADRAKLEQRMRELAARPPGERSTWIPGGLRMRRADGTKFQAEATLSHFEVERRPHYAIVLRDVNDRLEAERRIEALANEAEYLKDEIRTLQDGGEIIGRSAPLRRVLQEIGEVAATDATVLILGETGTGKEVVARAIHAASARRDRPFIKVNCAAVPAALMESEFFGHEKGAFTGALARREGRFALADRGTLFLDEIGDLPLDLQSKLLRVLQEGEFEPVGSSQTRAVDVRILAATNRDLQREIREGRFREDLYYRLNVFPVHMPPLRERGEDIVLLAEHFAGRHERRMGRRLAPLTAQCRERLKAYAWPGNVRELDNVIERAVITARDGRLNLDRALPEVEASAVAPPPAAAPGTAAPIRTVEELQALERSNLLLALQTAGWRVSGENGAAQLLGMHPSTLTSRMKALGIRRPR